MGGAHIATRSVQLSIVLDVEVDNVDSSASVMLNYLIRSGISSTSNDPRFLSSLVVLDCDGVLAYVLEPHKLEMTRAITVHPFSLILADDNIS